MVRSKVQLRPLSGDPEDLAFLPVTQLSELVRRRRVTSLELTQMYLARLKRYDPVLRCVITLTEDRAFEQAHAADAEIRRGKYRGPLHGIPWGAKDLLAVRGYKTTWGAGPYKDQIIDADATVVRRLDAAGAVLVAKLTLGELAQGDIWFGATTKNPWKVDQGSSGSSAGPASATAAGLVGFAIGSETLGSISSPSTRCGTTGLRPTFGRVPRTGAMALSWTMDKLGPICRSVEDCAIVLDAIHGPDGQDNSVIPAAFHWNANLSPRKLRVGYVKSAFDLPLTDPNDSKRTLHGTKKFDDAALDVFRKLGITLIPVDLPDIPYDAMRIILNAEAAAAFDELTRSGGDKLLVQQGKFDWPNSFRTFPVHSRGRLRERESPSFHRDSEVGRADEYGRCDSNSDRRGESLPAPSDKSHWPSGGNSSERLQGRWHSRVPHLPWRIIRGSEAACGCARVSGCDGFSPQASGCAAYTAFIQHKLSVFARACARACSTRGFLRSSRAHDHGAPRGTHGNRTRPGDLAAYGCRCSNTRRDAELHGIGSTTPGRTQ